MTAFKIDLKLGCLFLTMRTGFRGKMAVHKSEMRLFFTQFCTIHQKIFAAHAKINQLRTVSPDTVDFTDLPNNLAGKAQMAAGKVFHVIVELNQKTDDNTHQAKEKIRI
jgi:hypothetical protein